MRILVIEDDPDLRALYELDLRDAGHEVSAASNGAEGLARAAALPPDVVIVDLVMPVMDGYEFLQRLRRMPEHARTPVLVLSAVATGSYSRHLGASAFIPKPFDAEDLVSAVERCGAA